MSHIRRQIRDAMVARLQSAPALTGHVFVNRVDPFTLTELPAVAVVVEQEAVEYTTMGYPRAMERRLQAVVSIIVAVNTVFDDAMEDLAVVVEGLLGVETPLPLLPQITDLRLRGAEKGGPSGETASDVVVLRLTYEILALSRENDPETIDA